MNAEQRRRYARDLVADWPPLTPQQRTRVAVLLQAAQAAEKSEPADGKEAA